MYALFSMHLHMHARLKSVRHLLWQSLLDTRNAPAICSKWQVLSLTPQAAQTCSLQMQEDTRGKMQVSKIRDGVTC